MLLLNPDVTVDPQAVGRLADFLLTRPDAGAVGPRLAAARRHAWTLTRGGRFRCPSTLFYRTVGPEPALSEEPALRPPQHGPPARESDVHEMDAGTAACLMLRMAALDRVGFFDPRYFMFGEDVDLCYRLKLGGWKVFYLPTASAMHHEERGHQQARSARMIYERHRAMWTYHFKHHSEGRVGLRQRPGVGADLGPLGGGARARPRDPEPTALPR